MNHKGGKGGGDERGGGGGGGEGGGEGGNQSPPSSTLLHPLQPSTSLPPSSPSTSRARTPSREGVTTQPSTTTTTTDTTTTTTNITITLTPPPTTKKPTTTTTTTTTTSPPTSKRTTPTTTTSTSRSPPTSIPTTTTTHLSPYHTHRKASGESRLVVVGCPGVGKSALVVRLLTGRFIWEYDPTLEAAYRHHTTLDDEPAVMDIMDTAGQCGEEGGGVVSEGAMRWGEGFLLVFSLTDRTSFTAIPTLYNTMAAVRATQHFPCVIVANKTDLGHMAEVSEGEASELAGELGVSLFLTSASEGGPAITAAFSELHREVVRRRWSRRRRSSAKTVIEGFYKMFSR